MTIVDRWITACSKESTPLQAAIELTHRCNLRCPHCYIDNHEDQPNLLSYENWQDVLSQLRKAGTLYLNFLGGEPFLHPRVFDLAKFAAKFGFFVTFTTNGLLLNNESDFKKLRDIGVSGIAFSLYSTSMKLHGEMIGQNDFSEDLLERVLLSKRYLSTVVVNCLLTRKNIDEAIQLAQWCYNNNIQFRFDPYYSQTFEGADKGFQATSSQLNQFYKELGRIWPESKEGEFSFHDADPICNVARAKCSIDPYGNVMGCVEMRTVLGNLLNSPFSEIWSGEKAQQIRSMKWADVKEKGYACSHCPGMALKESGSPFIVTKQESEVGKIRARLCKS